MSPTTFPGPKNIFKDFPGIFFEPLLTDSRRYGQEMGEREKGNDTQQMAGGGGWGVKPGSTAARTQPLCVDAGSTHPQTHAAVAAPYLSNISI